MAKPKKRANGTWGIQFAVGGTRYSGSFPTAREANDWQALRKAELKAEHGGRGGEIHTLGEALRKFAEEVSPTHKGTKWEQARLERMQRELPVTLPMAKVGPEHIIAWRNKRLTQVKSSSARRDMSLLGSVFTTAVREWRWIRSSPMAEVSRPRPGKHREKIITAPEIRQTLRALGYTTRHRPTTMKQVVASTFLLALKTGMRSSEIVGLTWDRVHPVYVALPKTKNDDARDVPLSRSARRLLARMRGLDDEWVFPVSDQTRDTLFREARDRADLAGFTFHDARHTAATRIGSTVGQPGKLSFPEFVKVFGWRDPKHALIYVNPRAEDLAKKMG